MEQQPQPLTYFRCSPVRSGGRAGGGKETLGRSRFQARRWRRTKRRGGGREGKREATASVHTWNRRREEMARALPSTRVEAWICRNGGSRRMVSQRHRRWPGVAVRRDACTRATRLPQQRPINKRRESHENYEEEEEERRSRGGKATRVFPRDLSDLFSLASQLLFLWIVVTFPA